MREEAIPIPNGVPGLKLWPESSQDCQLLPVERAVLDATLVAAAGSNSALRLQLNLATCLCRHFDGYGAYLQLAIPAGAPSWNNHSGAAGNASLNWPNPSRPPLVAVAFFKSGLLELLEIFPGDGEGWSVEECRRALASTLDGVMISARQ